MSWAKKIHTKRISQRTYARQIRLFGLGFSIPILLMMILVNFFISVPIQRTFIRQYNDQTIRDIKSIDKQISQVETLVSNFGYSFENQFSVSRYSPNIDIDQIHSISRDLFVIENSNTLITDCRLVYTGKDSFIFEPSGTWEMANKKIQKLYKITNNRKFQWKVGPDAQLLFLSNVSDAVDGQHHLYLAVTIDPNTILDLFTSYLSPKIAKKQLVIDNQIVGKNSKFPFDLQQKSGSAIKKYNGDKYSINASTFTRLTQKWTLYSAIPLSQVTAPIHHFITVLIVIELILILISVLLGQIYAKRQYAPLKKTMNQIFGKNNWEQRNEFDYLIDKWHQLTEEQTNLQRVANQVTDYSRRMVIRQIVDGYYQYLSDKEQEKLVVGNGWPDWRGTYQLILIKVHIPPANINSDTIHNDFAPFAFSNIISDLANNSFEDCTIISRTNNCLLLFVTDEQPDIETFISAADKNINQIIHCYTTIAYSGAESSLHQLSGLYDRLNNSLRYRHIRARNVRINFAATSPTISYNFPVTIRENILTAFKNNRSDDLHDALQKFVEAVVEQDIHQIALISAISRLYDDFDYFLKQRHLNAGKYLPKQVLLNMVTNILRPDEIVELLYRNLFIPVEAVFVDQVQHHNLNMTGEIIDYLNTNFLNPNLSLEYVAEMFQIDDVSLSKSFKAATGQTFTDYLTDLRITTAKKKLIETNLQINVIAQQLGYTNSYFNRLFKRKVGVTPGAFRNNHS